MPMHTYNELDNAPDFIEPASAVAMTVVWSQDGQWEGDEQVNMKLVFDDSGASCFDKLVFNEKGQRRLDTFLKATGKNPAKKGEELEVNAAFVLNLRCFADVGLRTNKKTGKQENFIIRYVTDKGQPEALPF